jgi:hypothetical protein
LNIFIRVNSGGTILSYSDLLLSIATAQWKERDAREEITDFVDELNNIGDGFAFDKDFVLKTCLVLSDFTDIAFKVDNFNRKNMTLIEKNWANITQALRLTVTLISALGYHRDTLTSNNALIPIAYYLYNIGLPGNFVGSSKFKDDREKVFKWLIMSLLRRAFSGQPDTVLRPVREVLKKVKSEFPLNDIIGKLKTTTKSIVFSDDDIDSLFYYYYGQSYTYSTLAALYPTLDFRNKFHQDHIFPKKFFTSKKLIKLGVDPAMTEDYLREFNYLANLQLLEGIPNQEKAGKDFKAWLFETYPSKSDRTDYMKKHYIPDVDLSIQNFLQFIRERQALMTDAFKRILV